MSECDAASIHNSLIKLLVGSHGRNKLTNVDKSVENWTNSTDTENVNDNGDVTLETAIKGGIKLGN